MRVIKFRGMSLNGEWHYGNLAILTKKVGPSEAGSYISNSVGLPFAYDVRPETVGQFCGLLDKNGEEIYEGDIINFNQPSEVIFKDGCFVVLEKSQMLLLGIAHQSEVIGNIYEHSHILGDKNA